jgi:hypothetical protein
MSGFCEGTTVTSTSIKHDSNAIEQIKHVYSEEYCSGLLSGGVNSRSIFLAHLACQGKSCSCEHFAAQFLQQNEITDLQCYCKTTAREVTVIYPFLAVLVSGCDKVCVTFFSDEEYHVAALSHYSFEIRDCFLCDIDCYKFPNFIEQSDIIQNVDIYDVAQKIVDSLASSYDLWPKISGLGLSYRSSHDKVGF